MKCWSQGGWDQLKKPQHSKNQRPKVDYKKSFIYLWDYIKIYKGQFIFVMISSILISIFNAGVILGQYFFQKYLGQIVAGQAQNETTNIIMFAVFIFLAIFIIAGLFIFQVFVMTKVAQYSGKQIRKDLYFKLLELKLAYFDQNPSGDIMSKLTNDVNNITNALSQNVTQFMVNMSQIIIMLGSMFVFSPILASIALAFTPIQLIVVVLLFRKAQPNFAKKQKALGDINGFIEETISGQKVINNFNKQQPTIDAFEIKNVRIQKLDQQTQLLSSLVSPWNTFMQWFLRVLLLALAATFALNNFNFGGIVTTLNNQGITDPNLVIPLLTVLLLLVSNYSNPIYQIFQMLYLLQGAIAGAERAFAVKEQPIEVQAQESVTVADLQGEIEFKNLSFSYDGQKDVLKNINLHVKPGQVVGIVGPTGSGKTTIINLLTKFYDIDNEQSDILIDGISIKTITKQSLRDQVSIVLQDTFVFGGSVYENLRYAKADATNEEIEQAAQDANVAHIIHGLENNYETILENNAEMFSQGEKQLLAIARAFLKRSSILILDEATSSIDSKTEKDIQSAMIKLSKGKTTFMIAHRLSTIKHADIIVVLKDGAILEQGNHQELLAQNGFYAAMYNAKLNTPEDL